MSDSPRRVPLLNNHALLWSIVQDNSLTSTEKLVAMTLAVHRNVSTMSCCPSYNTLSKETKISRAWVVKTINSLIEKGVIVKVEPPRDGRQYKSNHYYFTFDLENAFLIDEESVAFADSDEYRCFQQAKMLLSENADS